jgi:hypothetical protein
MEEGGPNPASLGFECELDDLSLAELCSVLDKLVLMRIAKHEEMTLAGKQLETQQHRRELRKIERLYRAYAKLFEVKFVATKP